MDLSLSEPSQPLERVRKLGGTAIAILKPTALTLIMVCWHTSHTGLPMPLQASSFLLAVAFFALGFALQRKINASTDPRFIKMLVLIYSAIALLLQLSCLLYATFLKEFYPYLTAI